jgi:DNA helicase HerA-like ATPase
MQPITLGKAAHSDVSVDVPRLLETRMLVQSNSGGGKSWALRHLLEQTAPCVQQIVMDVEGEFTTLRERFDFVIGAPQEGDAAATPQTAAVLARKLRELRVSAILDIHDLKAHERQSFVRTFLDALMHAPREHWHPALLVLDEAHLFAPEHGKGFRRLRRLTCERNRDSQRVSCYPHGQTVGRRDRPRIGAVCPLVRLVSGVGDHIIGDRPRPDPVWETADFSVTPAPTAVLGAVLSFRRPL